MPSMPWRRGAPILVMITTLGAAAQALAPGHNASSRPNESTTQPAATEPADVSPPAATQPAQSRPGATRHPGRNGKPTHEPRRAGASKRDQRKQEPMDALIAQLI